MPQKIKYTKTAEFVNRSEELDYLAQWINKKPQHILFIYGPKSSGKTTLLYKFIETHLTNKYFNIKHFNLREMLIANYSDFIQAFFEVDYSKQSGDMKQKKEYNLKLFKLSKEIKKSLENKTLDPFVVMKKELLKISRKGKQPIIIIDELQALEDIYINGQRDLLKELFNFFVALTKESHLCHVIIASSDGYFMSRIYNDSKLTKTSDFFEINYLTQQDVRYWLTHLEQESGITAFTLTDEQIEIIWKYLGGSMFEISIVLGKLISLAKNKRLETETIKKEINRFVTINCGKFERYVKLNKQKFQLVKHILNIWEKRQDFVQRDLHKLVSSKMYGDNDLSDELNNLVRMNILAFNPTASSYAIQGNALYYGLRQYIQTVMNSESIEIFN
ncbi:MAG: ATPase [Candidatus Magnetoglobus multicellularis str. Araruama]|uniref:ATPase n=1 Tax=Candidatus Magnetoglobus multicellularis str. Araruama TaxID=890399 RepID=A0A1V1NZS1_9BACT|nr:MAG: ATPase [Candidatus Magnetoglobus multicellularis str. Araruama]